MSKINIDEKAIWEWMGFEEFEGQWIYRNAEGNIVYAEVLPPNIRSLDVQAKYLWPKLFHYDFSVVQLSGTPAWTVEIDRVPKRQLICKIDSDPATAVLLAVMEMIK